MKLYIYTFILIFIVSCAPKLGFRNETIVSEKCMVFVSNEYDFILVVESPYKEFEMNEQKILIPRWGTLHAKKLNQYIITKEGKLLTQKIDNFKKYHDQTKKDSIIHYYENLLERNNL